MELSKKFMQPAEGLTAGQFSFSTALGAACDGEMWVNLLPAAVKNERKQKKKQFEFIKIAIASALIIACASSVLGVNLYDKKTQVLTLDKRLKKVGPLVDRIELMQERIELIGQRLKSRGLCLKILSELHEIVPKQIFLGTFAFEEEKVTLRGSSKNMSDVFKFVGILEKSDYFHKVKLRYANKRKVQAEEITDFQITCPLSKKEDLVK